MRESVRIHFYNQRMTRYFASILLLNIRYKMSVEQNEVLAQQNLLLKSQIEKLQKLQGGAQKQSDADARKAAECTRLLGEVEV